ncbi:MAG TPA: 30S ribosomal protein S6 [Candidatus Woesebacteria bacterium]|nr:30S ribosomal protein S6 [Candidatus Woesebacteria bacterium]HPJ17194.1 30S ribosomal protein S6 [Candidatus Woesebacteria bacterium]
MRNNNRYQLVVILNPTAEDKQKDEALAKIDGWFESNQVTVEKKDKLGVKTLAYEINKLTKGEFLTWDLVSEKPMKIKEFNVMLNRNVSIIRYLVLKV